MEATNVQQPTTIHVRDYPTAGYKSYKWIGTGIIAMLPEPALAYATNRPDEVLQIGHLVMLRGMNVRILARHPGRPAYLVMREGRLARLVAWVLRKMLEDGHPTPPPDR